MLAGRAAARSRSLRLWYPMAPPPTVGPPSFRGCHTPLMSFRAPLSSTFRAPFSPSFRARRRGIWALPHGVIPSGERGISVVKDAEIPRLRARNDGEKAARNDTEKGGPTDRD